MWGGTRRWRRWTHRRLLLRGLVPPSPVGSVATRSASDGSSAAAAKVSAAGVAVVGALGAGEVVGTVEGGAVVRATCGAGVGEGVDAGPRTSGEATTVKMER